MLRPRRATVIAFVFAVAGVSFVLPTDGSLLEAGLIDTVFRAVLGGGLVCLGGLLYLRPTEIHRGTEEAPLWVLSLAGLSALFLAARLAVGLL